jgi:phage gp36-like protein
MAYTTVSEVRERLPIITETVRNDTVIQDFIAQGDALIDGYLRDRYSLPLNPPTDPLISYIALDLVCGLVLENVFGEDSPNDVRQSAILKGRAFRLLAQIAEGAILLQHDELDSEGQPRAFRPGLGSTALSDFALDDDGMKLPG